MLYEVITDEAKALLVGLDKCPWLFPIWHFLLRFVAPAAVLIVLLNQVGVVTG